MSNTSSALEHMRNPQTIRERCRELLSIGIRNELPHFSIDLTRMEPTGDFVCDVIRDNYRFVTQIPYHSRWRHFSAGGIDRVAAWRKANQSLPPFERLRREIELVITSVLLDAGAGNKWKYKDEASEKTLNRSEGLAIASWDMFMKGGFSGAGQNPEQANADGLQKVSNESLEDYFQVTTRNPLLGVDGRVQLMRNLGKTIAKDTRFHISGQKRLGHLGDILMKKIDKNQIKARDVLACVLDTLSPIWPGRVSIEGENLGDVWRHSKLRRNDATDQLVPFHKLSQWLTYSLLEPLEWYGVTITDLDDLTGLAEYRNGGLFVDLGVLVPRDPKRLKEKIEPSDEMIVEWRALTLALLDDLAPIVRAKLHLDAAQFPLAKMLEGGTWSAGRRIAAQLRPPEAGPPIQIASDGTVF